MNAASVMLRANVHTPNWQMDSFLADDRSFLYLSSGVSKSSESSDGSADRPVNSQSMAESGCRFLRIRSEKITSVRCLLTDEVRSFDVLHDKGQDIIEIVPRDVRHDANAVEEDGVVGKVTRMTGQ